MSNFFLIPIFNIFGIKKFSDRIYSHILNLLTKTECSSKVIIKLNLLIIISTTLLILIGLIKGYCLVLIQKINIYKNFSFDYLLFYIFCLILSVDLVANLKLEWDGHGWYFHALNFRENHKFFNLENFKK